MSASQIMIFGIQNLDVGVENHDVGLQDYDVGVETCQGPHRTNSELVILETNMSKLLRMACKAYLKEGSNKY
eukprot:10256754-Karenia_brevis.AAC.1